MVYLKRVVRWDAACEKGSSFFSPKLNFLLDSWIGGGGREEGNEKDRIGN